MYSDTLASWHEALDLIRQVTCNLNHPPNALAYCPSKSRVASQDSHDLTRQVGLCRIRDINVVRCNFNRLRQATDQRVLRRSSDMLGCKAPGREERGVRQRWGYAIDSDAQWQKLLGQGADGVSNSRLRGAIQD